MITFYHPAIELWYNFETGKFDSSVPLDTPLDKMSDQQTLWMSNAIGSVLNPKNNIERHLVNTGSPEEIQESRTRIKETQFRIMNPHLIHRWNETCREKLQEMKAQFPTYRYAIHINRVTEDEASLMTDPVVANKRWMVGDYSATKYALVGEDDAPLMALAGVPLINLDEITVNCDFK